MRGHQHCQRTINLAALIAAWLVLGAARPARAEYLGLGVKLHSTVIMGGGARDIYRVYAVFDHAEDAANFIGAWGPDHPINILSLNADGTGPGGNFVDNALGQPGDLPGGNLSFATIGDVPPNPDPIFIQGNSYFSTTAQWSTSGPWALAGNGVPGTFIYNGLTFSGMGVSILQLTVNAGDNIAGTINIGGHHHVDGEFQLLNEYDEVFSSIAIPAPGAAMTMVVMTLIGGARRRRCG